MLEFKAYRTEAEIEEIVRRFETCDYLPEEFFHARHLTVATWYFIHFDAKDAEERMRAGLMKFIRHHGKKGYHVTITNFWFRLVRHALREAKPSEESLARVNQVIEQLNNKGMIYEYFSRERVNSPEAKAKWIEPDLKALPGVE